MSTGRLPSSAVLPTIEGMSNLSSQTFVSHWRLLTIPFCSSLKHFLQLAGIMPSNICNLVLLMCSLFHTSSIVWSRKFIAMPSFFTSPIVLSSSLPAPLALAVQQTLTSPLGLVAKCIQGKGQKVLDIFPSY